MDLIRGSKWEIPNMYTLPLMYAVLINRWREWRAAPCCLRATAYTANSIGDDPCPTFVIHLPGLVGRMNSPNASQANCFFIFITFTFAADSSPSIPINSKNLCFRFSKGFAL